MQNHFELKILFSNINKKLTTNVPVNRERLPTFMFIYRLLNFDIPNILFTFIFSRLLLIDFFTLTCLKCRDLNTA